MYEPTILVTGDTHGNTKKLQNINYGGMTKEDYLIILGDFGFIFDADRYERQLLDKLNELPPTILFVDGNHENFDELYTYPKETWNGGQISKIRSSIYHLHRGEVFTIGSKKFFVMGGGYSIDKAWRKEGISWWPQEMPSKEEYINGLTNLKKVNCEVDYILTHSCSKITLPIVSAFAGFQGAIIEDALSDYLFRIEKLIKFKHWYFGHYHIDIEEIVDNQTALYDRVIKIQ